MSKYTIPQLEILTESLAKLPNIGRRSASRLAYHLISMSQTDADNFIDVIVKSREKIKLCKKCGNYTEDDVCSICASPKRDHTTMCIVEDSKSLIAFEKMGEFNGIYHVLHGNMNPGVNMNVINDLVDKLIGHLKEENVCEVIMATNPSIEGEATAMFISKLLRNRNIKCTRIAYGLPVGTDLDSTDEMTLSRAFMGRNELNN